MISMMGGNHIQFRKGRMSALRCCRFSRKIAAALKTTKGPIIISGHTDNVPISSGPFAFYTWNFPLPGPQELRKRCSLMGILTAEGFQSPDLANISPLNQMTHCERREKNPKGGNHAERKRSPKISRKGNDLGPSSLFLWHFTITFLKETLIFLRPR